MKKNDFKYLFLNILLSLFGLIQLNAQSQITSKELFDHNKFLASDSLKGRKPGTSESKIAAQYILDEFVQAGLKKSGNNGYQYFEIKSGLKIGKNTLNIANYQAAFEKEFTVLPYSESVDIKSDVVFAGYGLSINEEKLKWNDYDGIDVKGKFILILRGHPELDQRSSLFENYADDRAKVLTAKDKGAAGVIFVSAVKLDEKDELIPLIMGRADAKSGLPVLQVKREIANKILAKSSKKIEELELSLNQTKKSLSFDCNTDISVKTEVEFQMAKTQNVVGFIEGNDPKLKKEYIVIGAHYDHLGYGGPGSGSRRPDTLAIHNGADDNASGVATILEIAEYLGSIKNKLKRSILFISFDAEEEGLLGSQFFTKNPLVEPKQIKAMLNFDMVGRLNSQTKELSVGGTGTAKEWEDLLNTLQPKSGMKLAYSKEGFGPSDHSSFYSLNIPVLFFNTGVHEDYHTPNDDFQFINTEGQELVSKLGAEITLNLATRDSDLIFQEAGPKTRNEGRNGMKVKLGIMPGFAATDNNGVKVEGVTKGGIADKAGILKGDVVVGINGEKIENIYDYMNRLKKFNPGDRISVDILRGQEKKVFIVDL
ncbi:MAG: M28 family peptidase [Bacteroidales bacterium]